MTLNNSIDTLTTRCGRAGARLLAFVLVFAGALSAATTDQPSAAIAQPPAATTVNPAIPAQPAPSSSFLRGNEGIAALANGGFADFRRAQQTRILSAIDDTIATKTEDAITDNFAFVRKADLDFQSGIGGRKGNLGFNLIGSFADGADYAFGWQLRAYGGEDIDGGANAGVFYRRVIGGVLLGINTFADYERHEYGEFIRYSVGTEMANNIASFNANWYSPDGGGRNIGGTLSAFSREGFDAQLRVNAPRYNRLKAAVDYYNYNREDDTPRDNGFRFGVQWHPTPALRLNLFYDEGADEIGGDVGYAWTIGESSNRHSRADGAGISFDLFAPVLREHSQRLITASATPPRVSLAISVVGIMTTAVTTEAMTITTTRAAGLITITTRMTAASITTTTTMTTQAVTTTMTTRTETTTPTRAASVQFTVRMPRGGAIGGGILIMSTRHRALVTLPPAATPRPWALTLEMYDFPQERVDSGLEVFLAPGSWQAGNNFGLTDGHVDPEYTSPRSYTITVVEGSEEIISETTTTTNTMTTTMEAVITETTMTMPGEVSETTTTMDAMATTTTMTILAMSTTTRITTYATTRITLTTSAMGDIFPSSFPVDSAGISKPERRFPRLRRENDDDGNNKSGGITNPPPIINSRQTRAIIPA